jgi:Fe-S-cluster containining protein
MELSRQHLNAAATATYEHTLSELRNGADAATCEALGRRLAATIDAKFAAVQAAGATVACAPGCDFCCHQRVSVLPHEAIALFTFLRTRMPSALAAAVERRIFENAQRVDSLTVREHYAANIRCAFLVDGQCSAYAVRPSACATYHSLSKARCEYSFNHPQGIGTPANNRPALLELQAYCEALIEATQAAFKDAGLVAEKGELQQRLRTLLEDASAVERWSAGGELAAAQ